jgi:chromosome segregation protein
VQQAVNEKQAAFVRMRSGTEAFSDRLSSLRASVAAQAERLQAARSEIRRLENEAEELHSRINRNRVESYESHNRIEQLSESQAEGESATQQLDRERDGLAEAITLATEGLKTARERIDTLDAILREVRPKALRVRDERSHLEVEMARLESEAEHLARTCFAELAMRLEDAVAKKESGVWSLESGVYTLQTANNSQTLADGEESDRQAASDERTPDSKLQTPDSEPFDLDAAKARLDELRVKIDDLGPVNMMALEELEEADTRFQFLTEQRRDILESIRLTEEALSEIKRRSRDRFRQAFTRVNQNFQQMFVELFGGGRGEMILIDEEDVLESGIDLIAQPPGKRLQSVLLLSGGEKAMSAIALVLAIFQYKPSPFCILDEVDAPLDEMNVGRFAEKVTEMSRETQFLVITHNKRTMESAKALYGVTMEELGISKLVSVKFE